MTKSMQMSFRGAQRREILRQNKDFSHAFNITGAEESKISPYGRNDNRIKDVMPGSDPASIRRVFQVGNTLRIKSGQTNKCVMHCKWIPASAGMTI
jgi:hypothetical protein